MKKTVIAGFVAGVLAGSVSLAAPVNAAGTNNVTFGCTVGAAAWVSGPGISGVDVTFYKNSTTTLGSGSLSPTSSNYWSYSPVPPSTKTALFRVYWNGNSGARYTDYSKPCR